MSPRCSWAFVLALSAACEAPPRLAEADALPTRLLSSAFDAKLQSTAGSADEWFGDRVASGCDLDGDGFDELIVGARDSDAPDDLSGAAYVFRGGALGVDPLSELVVSASDGGAGDGFGSSLACAGDLNADGYDDIVVAAQWADGAVTAGGAVYVYLGSPTGLDLGSEIRLLPDPLSGASAFGSGVDGAGDVDGDGYDDIVVGSLDHADAGPETGAVFVFYGDASGTGARWDQLQPGDGALETFFGAEVAGAGDLDGDGYHDIVVGAPLDSGVVYLGGAIYVYLGGPGGVRADSEAKVAPAGLGFADGFGGNMSGGADFDQDGFGDLVVAASGDGTLGDLAGATYVLYGDSTGVDLARTLKLTASDGAEDDVFGDTVEAGGDVDGDGYDDLIVSAPWDDDQGLNSGSAYVYFGSAAGVDPTSEVKLRASDGAPEDRFGSAVHLLGDLNGDGYDDAVVGASRVGDLGAVYVFEGECRDVDADGFCSFDDCDDTDAAIQPGATEQCNGVDDDCDGTTDGPDSTDASTWEADQDGDGFTDPTTVVTDCAPPPGYAAPSSTADCDDSSPAINPGAVDLPEDGIDQDCNGSDATSGPSDPRAQDPDDGSSCGCATGSNPAAPWPVVLLLLATQRRRTSRSSEQLI